MTHRETLTSKFHLRNNIYRSNRSAARNHSDLDPSRPTEVLHSVRVNGCQTASRRTLTRWKYRRRSRFLARNEKHAAALTSRNVASYIQLADRLFIIRTLRNERGTTVHIFCIGRSQVASQSYVSRSLMCSRCGNSVVENWPFVLRFFCMCPS